MYYPEDRFLDGSQWHVLTYLGPSWCQKGSAYSSIDLVNYTKECTDKGGVITFDVFYGPTGLIVPEHFEQLMVIKSFIKDRESFDIKDIPESQNYLDGLSTLEVMDHIPYSYINIALRKPATASSYFHSSFDSCPPENAVNGSSKNGWAPDINDWSGSWLQIDLLKPERIDAIEMVDRNMGLDERKCFEIRASNDPEFNTYEVLLHQGEIALPRDRKWSKLINSEQKHRYVRFQAMPNNRHFVSQLKVYQDLSK